MTAASPNQGFLFSTIELNEAVNCRPKVAVASVALDQNAIALPANGRATLNATIAPTETFEREVAWGSSDPAVVEVRRIGEQIAMVVGKRPGTCTVTATIDKAKQTCTVTVTPSMLPTGWSYNELNTPPIPGSITVVDGKFTLTGCGHAMTSWWERVRDQGVFVSKTVTGDAEIPRPDESGPQRRWARSLGLRVADRIGVDDPRIVDREVRSVLPGSGGSFGESRMSLAGQNR